MDAVRSKADPAARQALLDPVSRLIEGMGQRSPVVSTPGKNEKSRRVEVIFAESQGASMSSLCRPPDRRGPVLPCPYGQTV